MILDRLGWSHDKQQAYIRTRCGNHEGSYEGALFTRSGDFIQKVGITSGQEDVSAGNGRRCRVNVKNATSLSSLGQERLLKSALSVVETTYVPNYGWCEVPVHWGPIMQADPGPTEIGLTARGVAELAGNNLLETKTLQKGHLVTNALRTVLTDWGGLRPGILDIPDLNRTLPKDATYRRGTRVWPVAVKLAESIGYDLVPDGRGHVWMRKLPSESCFDFFDEDAARRNSAVSTVLSAPVRTQSVRDSEGNLIPNWVQVHGWKPPKKGPGHEKPAIEAEAFADPRSIISRENLALNNGTQVVFHGVLHEYTNEHIKDQQNAQGKAEALIRNFEQISQQVTFDSRILPFFDFNDFVMVHAAQFLASFNLKAFSFSFSPNDSPVLSIGMNRPLSLAGSQVRPDR